MAPQLSFLALRIKHTWLCAILWRFVVIKNVLKFFNTAVFSKYLSHIMVLPLFFFLVALDRSWRTAMMKYSQVGGVNFKAVVWELL